MSLSLIDTSYHFKNKDAQSAYSNAYDAALELWPGKYQERYVETGFGLTHVRICGSENAPPLILMHGAQATSTMWSPHIEALSSKFRIYAVDAINDFGRSITKVPVRKVEHYVDWMKDVLDSLEIEKARFLGMSYGGWISASFAAIHPNRVESIALIAPAATFLSLSAAFLSRAVLTMLPIRSLLDSFYLWASVSKQTPKEVSEQIVNVQYKKQMGRLADQVWCGRRYFKKIKFLPPTVLSDKELTQISMPLLLLIGEQEILYNPSKAIERVQAHIPQGKGIIVPNASHDINFAQSEFLNQKILEFFEA